MRRELLLLEEMIDAAEQAHLLAADQTAESLASVRFMAAASRAARRACGAGAPAWPWDDCSVPTRTRAGHRAIPSSDRHQPDRRVSRRELHRHHRPRCADEVSRYTSSRPGMVRARAEYSAAATAGAAGLESGIASISEETIPRTSEGIPRLNLPIGGSLASDSGGRPEKIW